MNEKTSYHLYKEKKKKKIDLEGLEEGQIIEKQRVFGGG